MGGTAAPHPVPNDSTLTGTEQLSQTKSASPSCSPPFSTYNSPNGPIPIPIPIPITIPVSESESESVYVPPPDFPAAGCPMMNATGETPLLASMPTTAFLNIFPDAVLLVDPNRRIVVCNDAVCRLFGYPLSSLIGQAIEKLVPPKVQAYHGSLADRVFEDMIPREMANRKPVHGRHSSGRLFPATVQLIPCLLQLSPAEEPKKVVWCIARDMSGYNKAMHDRQQAEQHSALVGKFLRLLNHEVRTSIHAITNAMVTLSHELQEISVKPPSLPLLEVGVQQMSTLLTNMIDLRNLQENNMIQHHCFFQPSSVLSLLKDHTAALWLRKKQQLLLHCDSSIPAVYGDPHLVAKCLTPLIENSIKYSSDGACILISCTMHHDSISKIEHITGNTTPTIQLSPRRLRDETPSQTSDESGSGISDSAGGAGGSHGSTGSSSASNPTRQIQSTSVSLTSYARTPRIRSRDTPRIHTRQNSMDVGTSAIAAGLSPTPIPHSSPSPKISTIRSISHGKRKASKSGSPVETPSSPTIIRRERKRMIPLTSTPLQMELVRGRKSICEDDEMDMMTQPKPAPSTAPSLHSIPTITPSQPAAIPSESTSNQDGEDDGIDVHLVFRVSDCGPGLSQESLYSMAAGFFQVDASSTRNTAGGVGIGINLSKLAAESLHADLQVWSAPHTQPMTVPVDTVNENGKINGSTSPASSIPSTSPTSPTSNISATSPTHSFTYRDHAACDSDMICDRCAHTFQSMCSTCFTLTVPYIAFPNMVLDENMEPTVSISAPLSERSSPHPTVLNPQIQHDIIQSPHDHDIIHIQPIMPNGTSYHPSSHTTPSPSPSPPSSPSASSPQLTTASIPSSKIHTTATPALLHMPPLPITPIPTPVTTTTTSSSSSSSSSSLHTFNTVRQSTTTTPSSTHITLHTSTSPVSMDIDINGSTPHTSSITSTIPIPSVESSRPPQRPVGGNQNTVFNPKLKPHVLKKMASNDTKQARSEFKILIVEDNLINVKVIRQCLVKRGFNTITVAENGQIALDIIEARWRESELAYQSTSSTKILPTSIEQFVTPFPFQVILMDCEMPIMDGYTCTARLRDRGVKCPIVALTANATLDAQKLCASAGMDLYLTKPLCAEDLLFALASLPPFSMYPSDRCPYALMAHFSSTRQHAQVDMQIET